MTSLGELLFSPATIPFSVALGLMVCISLLEGVATLLGIGLSGMLDGLIPEIDTEVDVDPQVPEAGGLSRALGWLHVGRVPILMLFVLFLTFFGLAGLMIQKAAETFLGAMVPALLASVPAFLTSLSLVRVCGGVLSHALPQDETDAVSAQSFVGRVATMGAATASPGNPAQAKLRDQHGQAHYVLVEPDVSDEHFGPGTEVLLVRRAGARFFAIRNTHVALSGGP